MGFITTETYSEIPRTRTPVLLEVRPYQCSYIGSPNDSRPYPFGRGVSNGSGAVLNEKGRLAGVSSGDRVTGARSQFQGSDGIDSDDPFADWQSSAPVVYPENIDELDSRTAYLIGRSHGKEEQFENLMPAVLEAIEIASR